MLSCFDNFYTASKIVFDLGIRLWFTNEVTAWGFGSKVISATLYWKNIELHVKWDCVLNCRIKYRQLGVFSDLMFPVGMVIKLAATKSVKLKFHFNKQLSSSCNKTPMTLNRTFCIKKVLGYITPMVLPNRSLS